MLAHPAQQVLPHGIHLAPLGHAQRVVQLNRHHGYALLQTAVIAQGAGEHPQLAQLQHAQLGRRRLWAIKVQHAIGRMDADHQIRGKFSHLAVQKL